MRWLLAFSFALLVNASQAKAAIYQVDLTQPGGIPGTSGLIFGPCNCFPPGPLSPIYTFQSGDIIEFGTVTIFPVEAIVRSPPGAPPQPRTFISGGVGVSFADKSPYPDSMVTQCAIGAPCDPPLTTVHLLYEIPAGFSQIQLGWYGDYVYTPASIASAVPEPSTWAMLMFGFAGIGSIACRRRRTVSPPPERPGRFRPEGTRRRDPDAGRHGVSLLNGS